MASARFARRVSARPEAVGELRRQLVDFAHEAGADADTVDAVALAASEAFTNVVMHAYAEAAAGDIIVEAWRPDGELIVLVCDEGPGLMPRTDSPGLGLGLGLMAQMADELQIGKRQDMTGTMISMSFRLDGRESDGALATAPGG